MSVRSKPISAKPPVVHMDAPLTWADLSETEKSAASLGVNPNDFKPISFLNTAHYESLLKNNKLDESLAKKLEAYKSVAKASGLA